MRQRVTRGAFIASIVLHLVALSPWTSPFRFSPPNDNLDKEAAPRMQVRITPRAMPEPPVQVAPPPQAAARAPSARRETPPANRRETRPPSPAMRKPPPPSAPVIALNTPKPTAASPATAAPEPPAPPPPRPAGTPAPAMDMTAMLEARRRARGDPPPPPPAPRPGEDDNARRDRIVAENLGSQRAPSYGQQAQGSGGIFQLEHVYYDYADFTFYGWNRDISRNARQLIEVRKGNYSDIRIAVVRRMIAIIREYEQEDFRWESTRLKRSVILSARQRDTTGLEEFLMREFFEASMRQP